MGPRQILRVIPDCAHAPALMDAAQVGVIRDWLESHAPEED